MNCSNGNRWYLYDELLATVPTGATITNFVAGRHWLMVESSLGGVKVNLLIES